VAFAELTRNADTPFSADAASDSCASTETDSFGLVPNLPVPLDDRFPDVARAALPANYKAARQASAMCVRVDEFKEWSDRMAPLASYT
jgi:hypothetical protein